MTDVGTLSWDEVERRGKAGAIAILPVGAGAKEHGLHLPMATDRLQADWFADRLGETFDALVWPTLTYGFYPAFVDYPGSCSLSAATFGGVISELVAGMLRDAPRGVVIVDTGISTIPVIARAIEAFRTERVLHLRVHDGPRYREVAARLETQSHGGHADELETARMRVLAPRLVRMDRAVNGTTAPHIPGPLQRSDPEAPNYSPSGATGDPRGATVEMGAALLEAMAADNIEAVRAWLEG